MDSPLLFRYHGKITARVNAVSIAIKPWAYGSLGPRGIFDLSAQRHPSRFVSRSSIRFRSGSTENRGTNRRWPVATRASGSSAPTPNPFGANASNPFPPQRCAEAVVATKSGWTDGIAKAPRRQEAFTATRAPLDTQQRSPAETSLKPIDTYLQTTALAKFLALCLVWSWKSKRSPKVKCS